ncbi:hypothetical protein Nmel_007005 [Mimus melanotis]
MELSGKKKHFIVFHKKQRKWVLFRGFLLVQDKLQNLKQLVACTAPSRRSLANLQRQVECANAHQSQGPAS